jgi:hypothetical protein
MSRAEWLAGLAIGDPVRLVTPCGIHLAEIEGRRDNRLWVHWALGFGGQFGTSSTWVGTLTGDNAGHSYRIEPAESEIAKRESFND